MVHFAASLHRRERCEKKLRSLPNYFASLLRRTHCERQLRWFISLRRCTAANAARNNCYPLFLFSPLSLPLVTQIFFMRKFLFILLSTLFISASAQKTQKPPLHGKNWMAIT